jgi:lipopolysaccharide/colanic/teichoic acid biosynthesis glycosyltransferase/UDP-glucose 6-dehydrogenase
MGIHSGRLRLADAGSCASLAPVLFVCVDTAGGGGSATTLTPLEELAASLNGSASQMDPVLVVLASRVPVGTADWLQHLLGPGFEVASLPASPSDVEVAAHPVSVSSTRVVGAQTPQAAAALCRLFGWDPAAMVVVSRSEAELVQAARESAVAVHFKLVHEVAAVAERMGTDVTSVLRAAGLDRRHGSRASDERGSWGNGEMQRSARILSAVAETAAVEAPALGAASKHSSGRSWDVDSIIDTIGQVKGRRIGIWGLSHADETPDPQTRAAVLARTLEALGADVSAYDPDWGPDGSDMVPGVRLVKTRQAALEDRDILLVVTERPEFELPEWGPVAVQVKEHLVIDVRPRAREMRPGATADSLPHYAPPTPEDPAWPAGGIDAHAVEGLPQMALVRAFLTRIPESSVENAAPRRIRPARRWFLYPTLKRVLDVTVSSLSLVILAPLLGLVALTTLVDSGRPILFSSTRVGRHGRPFVMFKFRTMRTNAPVVGNKSDTGHYATRVGRWLRVLNVDEMPQLWNVLIGDMSLVGPRPEQPHIAEWYQPWQSERLTVPPGITGWWQLRVRGSNNEMYQHVEFDVWYVRNAGFWLDVWLLILTPLVLLGIRPRSWSQPLAHRAEGASA